MKKLKSKNVETKDVSKEKRSNLVNFTVKYDGRALESNEMDANELANSLLGISNVLEEANSTVNVLDSKLFIKVQSGFKAGSFEVDISSFYHTGVIQTVFNSGDTIGVIVNIATLVGFVYCAGNGVINTLIGLCRITKGKKILTKKSVGNGNCEITVEGCEKAIIVNNPVINIYEDKRARQELERAVSPLHNEGISDITFLVDGEEQEKILREERDYFSYTNIETIQEVELIASFYITQANFDGKNTGWRLSFGDSSISQNKSSDFPVKILDEKFLKKVLTKKLIISSDGTAIIRAKYRKITHISDKLNVRWEVLEVLETESPAKNYPSLDDF